MPLLLRNQDVSEFLSMDSLMQVLDGIQFAAMAKLISDLAKELGVGRQLPLEWFQQDVNS